MRRRSISAMLLLAALPAACGGSDTSAPAPTPSASIPADQQGTPAPEALSTVACAATEQGTWTATGVVSNTADAPVTYRVTAYVGPADGQPRPAATTTLDRVQADGSTPFELVGIVAHGEAPTCHVQVLIPD